MAVFWLDGHDLVTIAAAGPDLAADAATRWLNATGVDDEVTAPEPIPEITPLPPAPKDLADEIGDTPTNGHVATNIATGDLDILLVGHDDKINDLARAWSQNVDQQ